MYIILVVGRRFNKDYYTLPNIVANGWRKKNNGPRARLRPEMFNEEPGFSGAWIVRSP